MITFQIKIHIFEVMYIGLMLVMGEYSSKKSLSCQNSDFVNPYLTNFVLEHYLHFLGYFENFELKDLGI